VHEGDALTEWCESLPGMREGCRVAVEADQSECREGPKCVFRVAAQTDRGVNENGAGR
jgi:hypothetical protein